MPAVPMDAGNRDSLCVGRAPLCIEDVIGVAEGRIGVALEADPGYRARLERGAAAVERALAEGRAIYGVSTGVGASVENAIPEPLRDLLPRNVARFHGCGTGRILGENESAAVVAVRLASLARGYSGVRPLLLERLCDFLNLRLLPRIPEEGSVGASGDLTPLSYLAAALLGEREVSLRGELFSAADGHARAGLEPLALRARESLAIMNGTSVMAALGCLGFGRALRLARWASALTAVACDAMRGNPAHFDARIFALKPHPGTQRCAAWIRADLRRAAGDPAAEPARLQDRYSLRCAPHVIGVLLDALDFSRSLLEIELNGVNDNPMVDPESGDILHGGNFYGGHLCFALDGLKTAVANVADLLDRQLCLLCDPATQRRSARESGGGAGACQRGASRLQGDADHGLGAHRRGAQAQHARERLQPQHGVAQSGQGQHGDDRRARLSAGARARARRSPPCTRSRSARPSICAKARPARCAAAPCATPCARRFRSTSPTAARTATSRRCWRCTRRASFRRAISIPNEREAARAGARPAGAAGGGVGGGGVARIPSGPLTLEVLMHGMATSTGVRAEFREEKTLALLESPLVSEGTLYFIPPSRMARITTRPGASSLVIDGQKMSYTDETGASDVDLAGQSGRPHDRRELRGAVRRRSRRAAGALPRRVRGRGAALAHARSCRRRPRSRSSSRRSSCAATARRSRR